MTPPPSAPSLPACHLCGGVLAPVEGAAALLRVTSDCRPWPAGGALAVCRACATLQTPVDAAWRDEAAALYADYAVYAQAGGAEQRVFAPGDGAAQARSDRLVSALCAEFDLPETGRLLDFGCGNGAFLAAFGRARPGWRLTGLDQCAVHRAAILALPGVEAFLTEPPAPGAAPFDLVAMIHSLEHLPDPAGALRETARLLAPGGRLFLETPDIATSPFDLVIADHVSHFTAATLTAVVRRAGLHPLAPPAGWVAKELALVAAAGAAAGGELAPADPAREGRRARALLDWLTAVLAAARAAGPGLAVFGTSISGTWLAHALADQVALFIDEDVNRIGRHHLGRPIVAPDAVPPGQRVVLPFPPAVAAGLAARLAPRGWDLLSPPALEGSGDA